MAVMQPFFCTKTNSSNSHEMLGVRDLSVFGEKCCSATETPGYGKKGLWDVEYVSHLNISIKRLDGQASEVWSSSFIDLPFHVCGCFIMPIMPYVFMMPTPIIIIIIIIVVIMPKPIHYITFGFHAGLVCVFSFQTSQIPPRSICK